MSEELYNSNDYCKLAEELEELKKENAELARDKDHLMNLFMDGSEYVFNVASNMKINDLGQKCKRLEADYEISNRELLVKQVEITALRAELSQAVGLITTLKPTMVMDVDHPLDMAKEVTEYVTARIAELEAEQAHWVMVSERLPNKSGWYLAGLIGLIGWDGGYYTAEVPFDTETGLPWRSSVRDEVYCWLDEVPELPKPPEVQE